MDKKEEKGFEHIVDQKTGKSSILIIHNPKGSLITEQLKEAIEKNVQEGKSIILPEG